MDFDPTVLVGTYWPVPILGFVVLAIVKGWLVPRATVDQLTKQWEDRLNEAHVREQTWQKAALTSEETRRDVADQLRTSQATNASLVKVFTDAARPAGATSDPSN